MPAPLKSGWTEIVLAWAGAAVILLVTAFLFVALVPACAILPIGGFGICDVRSIAGAVGRVGDLALERARLEAEIAVLEREVGLLRCEPAPEAPERAETQEPRPELEPEPEPQEQLAECAPALRAARTTETVFLVDTSSSMEFSIDLPASMDRELGDAARAAKAMRDRIARGDFMAALQSGAVFQREEQAWKAALGHPGRNRIEVAREIVVDAIRKAPGDLDIGLVSFVECNARGHGTYPPAARQSLIGAVQALRSDAATPLARAIESAAGSLAGGDDADDPVNIVVLSDGQDSCEGDPCAAAARAKSRKPGLVINIVDLSQTGDLKCVSDATGGFYRRQDGDVDLADLSRSLREAAGYEGEGLCRQ